MPSKLRIRERLIHRQRAGSGTQVVVVSPRPAASSSPSIVAPARYVFHDGFSICCLQSHLILHSLPNNEAFQAALKKHLDKLDPVEKDAFEAANRDTSQTELLAKVKRFDEDHSRHSSSRRCFGPLTKFFQVLDQFMGGVAIAIQSNPEISSLVVGGVRFVIDVSPVRHTFLERANFDRKAGCKIYYLL